MVDSSVRVLLCARLAIVLALGTAAPMSAGAAGVNGCAAVNAGALDLKVVVDQAGLRTGAMGSGWVAGFQEGDVLTFRREARAGARSILHELSLAASDSTGSGQISTVLDFEDKVIAAGEQQAHIGPRYEIPRDGANWSLFTSSFGEGEGEYTVTVRCEPADSARAKATSSNERASTTPIG